MPVRTIQYLNDADAAALAEPVLRRVFAPLELQSLKVWSEIDFDGEEVLKVLAVFDEPPLVKKTMEAVRKVQDALREKDDDRYVFLTPRNSSDKTTMPATV